MSTYGQFLIVFLGTVALLGADYATGSRGARKVHLGLVALTVVGLVVSVVLAIRVGREWDFTPWVQRIHRTFSTSVLLVLVPVAASGIGILLGKRTRPFHRRAATLLLAVAVAATVTGFWMKSTGIPAP